MTNGDMQEGKQDQGGQSENDKVAGTDENTGVAKKKPVKDDQGRTQDNRIRYIVPAVVTLALGVATFWMDSRITERAERAQRAQLYTQLISNREQASSGMRKDMFVTILSGFLSDKPGDPNSLEPPGFKELDKQLLKLELLALNFGETLSLSPLFGMMDRRIRTQAMYANNLEWQLDKPKLEARLSSLARRVADSQRSSLEGESDDFKVEVPRKKVEFEEYAWPELGTPQERKACLVLDGIQRRIMLNFSNAKKAKKIDVTLAMRTYILPPEASEECRKSFEQCDDLQSKCPKWTIETMKYHSQAPTKPFTIDHFNLPLIDNSLLSNDQRFALIMRDFNEDNVEIVGILFPGQYAGRRDKLTLDQAIERLKGDLN